MAVDLHEDYNLGKALQRIRKHRDWTLAKVAEKTGVAISTLSKLENNQSSPSYDVLIRLAEGLGMGLLELVKSESFSTFAPGARAINRGDKGVQYETPLGEYLALSSELAKKSMQPTLIRLPKGKRAPEILSCHGGEEFVYVLRGRVKFYMEPYAPVDLEQGESAQFDSLMPHGFIALDEEDAWILAVCQFNMFSEEDSTESITPPGQSTGDAGAGENVQE